MSKSNFATAGPKLTFGCSVRAVGVVEATLAEMPALRDQPGPASGRQPTPRFLRHSDEQTVVGLAAVLRAIDSHQMHETCFDDWGVLAAPQFPGRIGSAAALDKYRREGPTTISPHVIPQNSLHSVSGAISVVLGMHGPNFGIGGGREALAEGLTVALTFPDWNLVPGLWLVCTQLDPDPTPDGRGSSTTETVCRGVALALGAANQPGMKLRLHTGGDVCHEGHLSFPSLHTGVSSAFSLAELAALLTGKTAHPWRRVDHWSLALPWGDRVELELQPQQQARAA